MKIRSVVPFIVLLFASSAQLSSAQPNSVVIDSQSRGEDCNNPNSFGIQYRNEQTFGDLDVLVCLETNGGGKSCFIDRKVEAGEKVDRFSVCDGTGEVSVVALSEGQQNILCENFPRDGIGALKDKAQFYGYNVYEIYDLVKCDDLTQADLLKYRTRLPSGRADLMSFARYYIREFDDAEGLTRILNTVVDNPGRPRGTLLDFIDFYADNPLHTEQDRINFAAYEVTIRRFGGMRESELDQ